MLVFTLFFFVFLLVSLAVYYSVGKKGKPYTLLFFSLIFISSISVKVAIFSFLFTALNYFFGIFLSESKSNPKLKSRLFWIFIFTDVGSLCFFKFFSGLVLGLDSMLSSFGSGNLIPHLNIIIPVGISYYTFQALGYLIRINRGSEEAQRDFGKFGIYLLFFPKFLAGPVERSNHFFPQMEKLANFNPNDLSIGCRLFLWGMFKKIVIANSLFDVIQNVNGNVHRYTGIAFIIVFLIQPIYMYCDFSGYTDMAMGTAKLFGIDIIDNFKRPFLAKNVSDYWRRWHISLSSWCNDFIYNPLIVKYRQYGNTAVVVGIFITFFIVGIWHGPNWTYVMLGILQALAIIYEFYTKKYRLKFASKFSRSTVNTVSRIIVYLFTCFSMTFFFSNTIGDSWYFLSHIFRNVEFSMSSINFIENKEYFLFAIFFFILLYVIEIFNEKGKDVLSKYLMQPLWVQWAGYIVCFFLIYIFRSEIGTFYYMRF
jgi:alginate O-acetyltransferase complex protein AlgI